MPKKDKWISENVHKLEQMKRKFICILLEIEEVKCYDEEKLREGYIREIQKEIDSLSPFLKNLLETI